MTNDPTTQRRFPFPEGKGPGVRSPIAYFEAHQRTLDLALIALVTAIAAALRLASLGRIPYGVHPDEAQLGTDAHRIMSEGWIGVYTHAALGQPAGHSYLATPAIWLFGDTPFALRLTLALVALVAVPLLYLVARVSLGRAEAFFASLMLAISYWHLLYSRVSHWSISYGTVVLAVLLCLLVAMRTRQWPWFAAAGLLLGAGVYTYNVYPIAIGAVAVSVAIVTIVRYRGDLRWWLRSLALMFGVALIVAAPMIWYVADPDAYYWQHLNDYSNVSVRKTPEYRQADTGGKIRILAAQAKRFAATYAWNGRVDDVDGNGLRPMFDPLTLVLLLSGIAIAIRRRGEPAMIAALCCFAIIPLPAVLQRGSMMRGPVGAAPFAMLLAALPLAAVWRGAMRETPVVRAGAVLLIACFVAFIGAMNVHDYFWTWRESPVVRQVYFSEMTTASDYMRALPPAAYVYFYSERASINLEMRQFLAPDVRGEDRSREFSALAGSIDGIDRTRPAVFVLLGPYVDLLPSIEARYPGGAPREFSRDGKFEFVAYEVGLASSQ